MWKSIAAERAFVSIILAIIRVNKFDIELLWACFVSTVLHGLTVKSNDFIYCLQGVLVMQSSIICQ